MSGAARIGDKARVAADSHGRPCCPHECVGAAMRGSSDVFIEDRGVVRLGDHGTQHCCGTGQWHAAIGASGVYVNDRPMHRNGDQTMHCGGIGTLIEGSATVLIGDEYSPSEDPVLNPKVEVQIVHRGGDPLAGIGYELLDSKGSIVAQGVLDANGWLRVPSVKWGIHTVRLENGWLLEFE